MPKAKEINAKFWDLHGAPQFSHSLFSFTFTLYFFSVNYVKCNHKYTETNVTCDFKEIEKYIWEPNDNLCCIEERRWDLIMSVMGEYKLPLFTFEQLDGSFWIDELASHTGQFSRWVLISYSTDFCEISQVCGLNKISVTTFLFSFSNRHVYFSGINYVYNHVSKFAQHYHEAVTRHNAEKHCAVDQ